MSSSFTFTALNSCNQSLFDNNCTYRRHKYLKVNSLLAVGVLLTELHVEIKGRGIDAKKIPAENSTVNVI
jgi:hypothetical protein